METAVACSKDRPSGRGMILDGSAATCSAYEPCACPKTRSKSSILFSSAGRSGVKGDGPPRLYAHPSGMGELALIIPAYSTPSMKGRGGFAEEVFSSAECRPEKREERTLVESLRLQDTVGGQC